MAASFTLPTVLANLAAGNQALSLIDGDLTTLRDPLLSLNTFANYYTDTGAANAYVITVSSPQAVTQSAGLTIQFLATLANTGASTLQINALAAKNIINRDGSALLARQITGNSLVTVIYDGTSYQLQGASSGSLVPRSYISGLTMSTAGGSATMTVAAGQATDSTNVAVMSLASALGKTTSAWAVGTGNGGLDTGAIANSTWYHFYLITRLDTAGVDVLFSLSASAPTMPATYTLKRRIGSGKTDGAAQWTKFKQFEDTFMWDVPLRDVNTTNIGTAAVLETMTVPTGVNVDGIFSANDISASTAHFVLVTPPDLTDTTPSATAYTWSSTATGGTISYGNQFRCITNTSAQIRYRQSASGASDVITIVTSGWRDFRGKDS